MSEPASVERARALIRHARYCGSPLHQFYFPVSATEGFELLDWLCEMSDSRLVDRAMLTAAIAEAKATQDPYPLLAEFRLLGLEVVALQ